MSIQDDKVQEIIQREMTALLPPHLDEVQKRRRLRALRYMASQYDPTAMYYYGIYLLSGSKHAAGKGHKIAWKWLYIAAQIGSIPAKHLLDQVCKERYEKAFSVRVTAGTAEPLKDFDGKEIKIHRTGVRTPVDAVLSFENGENILTLSADLNFADEDVYPNERDAQVFENAVMDGIREWEGEYEVFGGQKVRIRIELSVGQNKFDTIKIIPLSKEIEEDVKRAAEKIPWSNTAHLTHSRAFSILGFRRWTATTRKCIVFREPALLLKNPESIREIAKHEFGHVIGLGDLYQAEVFKLQGADSSGFPELQSYEILPKAYHLVMSNTIGPISNNDIEMVILAFSENRLQSYQPDQVNRFVSKALGRGN